MHRERQGRHGDDQPRRARSASSSTSSPFRTRASFRPTRRRRTRARSRSPERAPYYFASYDPNKQLVMKRNPYFKQWSKDAQPEGYADEITESFGLTVEAADHRDRERPGRLDARGAAGRPAERDRHEVREAGARHPLTAFWYAPMNINLAAVQQPQGAPGGQLRVDRNAAVKIFGGPKLATPSCQVCRPASRATRTTARTRRTRARTGRRPTSRRRRRSSRRRARPDRR